MADMKLPMDLRGNDSDMPCCPVDVDKSGPRVHLSWDEPYNLPDEGEMTVKFKVKRREERINGEEKHYELAIELVEITDVKDDSPKAPAKGESDTGTILDEMKKSLKG